MSQTLYRKYRPQTWSDVAGQNHVKVTLAWEVGMGKIAHAYLFSGPRGVGKTTAARIFSRAINCEARKTTDKAGEPCGTCESCVTLSEGRSMDVIEIDAASHRGIDNVRDNIIENARFSPTRLAYKVFIIDEVHMLTTEAFNALLKTLEEPPAHAVFILATTELHKVPPTIVSRCQRFDFKKIPFTDLVERLHGLAEKEGCKVDKRTLEEIARNSDGCLRDAEGLLGKVLAVADGKRISYDEALVVLPRSDFALVSSFVESLLRTDGRAALQTIGDCLESGLDIDQFAGDVIELLRKILLTKMSGNPDIFTFDLDEESKKKLVEWAAIADTARVARSVELLLEKRRDIKISQPSQLPLEIAVVRLCEDISAAPAFAVQTSSLRGPVEQARSNPAPSITINPSAPPRESLPSKILHAVTGTPHRAIPSPASEPSLRGPQGAEAIPSVVAQGIVPATETVPGSVSPVNSTITLETLQKKWPEFAQRAGQVNHGYNILLANGELKGVDGDTVQVGFSYGFHRNKLNEPKNKLAFEKVLATLFGVALRIEGVHLDKKPELGHDDAVDKPELETVTPTVADHILNAFGGRVVE
jgi:DNA polymerase-3 subunit gamma/tau